MNPFPCGYEPSLDVSQELDPVIPSYYQSQIKIPQWMVEFGWIDINTKNLMFSSHLALQREVQLEVVLNIVSYLQGKHNSRLALDPTYPGIDHAIFKK